jgi:hypothetical protein
MLVFYFWQDVFNTVVGYKTLKTSVSAFSINFKNELIYYEKDIDNR